MQNFAALHAAVFPLFMKNLKGGGEGADARFPVGARVKMSKNTFFQMFLLFRCNIKHSHRTIRNMYVQLESIIHVWTKYQISIFYQYKMMDQKLIAFF